MTLPTDALLTRLYEIESIKLGEFKLKSGVVSPIYMDLRQIISFPDVLKLIADLMWEHIQHLDFDLICGVPYTALPIASCVSLQHDIPMIMRRKEAKDYGTKKMLEGVYRPGQKCLILEDVITSGGSVKETATLLREHELVVTDTVVFVDRQQGGKTALQQAGIQSYTVINLTSVIEWTMQHHVQEGANDKLGELLASLTD